MRLSIITAGLLVAAAVASPILRGRAMYTDIVVVTETITITAGEPLPTSSSSTTSSSSSSTLTITPTPTPEPAPEPTPTPTPTPQPVPTTPTTTEVPYVTPASAPGTAPAEFYQPSPAPTETPPPPPPPTATGYEGKCLEAHNNARSKHGVPALQWDDNLANIAAQIASSCVFAHNMNAGGGGYGQNIGWGTNPQAIDSVVNMFYDEVSNFNQYGVANPDMSNFPKWGHFSQVVWKSTSAVGCATQSCGGNDFTVCNYKAPGNFGGQYAANIFPPK